MDSPELQDARGAFERREWARACAAFTAADARTSLDADDLERLATAAYLVGDDAASVAARTRAHGSYLARRDLIGAARAAFWTAFTLIEKHDQRAQGAGWLARAERLIDEANEPCVERGWLLCAAARQRAAGGDLRGAHDTFAEAASLAVRFGNLDLLALARHGMGRARLAMNDAAAGLTLLDEVMVAVAGGEVGPIVAGTVYCSVISACHDLFDLARAQEWTAALQRWCDSQPDLVPFRGFCLIHRAELMQLHGAWHDAFSQAERACAQLTEAPARPEAGAARYQLAELHRLRGELAAAEDGYRLASQAGWKPHPGLALLRLAQGQVEAADAAIRTALQDRRERRARVLLLGAAVEIMLAAKDVPAAHTACDELVEIAARLDCAFLRAASSQARGAIALAETQLFPALEWLRTAAAAWQELDAPYERARTRELIGLVCRSLGDREGAQLEFEAAQEAFDRLGAAPDARRVSALTVQTSPGRSSALTGREVEVLRLIATGAPNRAIAARLGISEKTVARHVSNIFTKLDLSSRAAATAYAYESKLI